LWTAANFWGSCGEKYGEKGHSSAHLLLKSLHAAQGVTVFKITGGPNICLLPIREDASLSLLILFPNSSDLSLKHQRKKQYYMIFQENTMFFLSKFQIEKETNRLDRSQEEFLIFIRLVEARVLPFVERI
jgi:hypothetical protein